jgi:hypothetical protein
MPKEEPGFYKKIMGAACHHCPLCKYGRSHPESLIGKMLHSKLHADHCPMWKAEKEIYGEPLEDR